MLTNIDLHNICNSLKIPLVGIFTKDDLPKRPINGLYIFNMSNSNDSGTHWMGAIVKSNSSIYFDSFACPPPEAIQSYLPKPILYNKKSLQPLEGQFCGWAVIIFLYKMQHSKGTLDKRMETFLKPFKQNDSLYNENYIIIELSKINKKRKT